MQSPCPGSALSFHCRAWRRSDRAVRLNDGQPHSRHSGHADEEPQDDGKNQGHHRARESKTILLPRRSWHQDARYPEKSGERRDRQDGFQQSPCPVLDTAPVERDQPVQPWTFTAEAGGRVIATRAMLPRGWTNRPLNSSCA
jgi:hypothetical protein